MYYINYGDRKINYNIIRKNVKNINLTVKPNLEVSVSANHTVPLEYIQKFVTSKAKWIEQHLSYYENKKKIKLEEKQYRTGEYFQYLGKQYSLKVIQSSKQEVKCFKDDIYLYVADIEDFNKKNALMERWYKKRSQIIFEDALLRTHSLVKTFKKEIPELKIRKMKSRWGTCYPDNNKIILNRMLIKAPKDCIDYVVLHELIHFKYRKHNKDFYRLLGILMPNWEEEEKILDEVIVKECKK